MFRVNRFPALLALSFALLSSAQQPATSPQAQATSAPDYMKQAEQRLSDAAVRASRASWVQETYITDDTEAIAADANNDVLATVNQLVMGAKPFEREQLDPVLKRKFWLLKLSLASPAPNDPAQRKELASSADPSRLASTAVAGGTGSDWD